MDRKFSRNQQFRVGNILESSFSSKIHSKSYLYGKFFLDILINFCLISINTCQLVGLFKKTIPDQKNTFPPVSR